MGARRLQRGRRPSRRLIISKWGSVQGGSALSEEEEAVGFSWAR